MLNRIQYPANGARIYKEDFEFEQLEKEKAIIERYMDAIGEGAVSECMFRRSGNRMESNGGTLVAYNKFGQRLVFGGSDYVEISNPYQYFVLRPELEEEKQINPNDPNEFVVHRKWKTKALTVWKNDIEAADFVVGYFPGHLYGFKKTYKLTGQAKLRSLMYEINGKIYTEIKKREYLTENLARLFNSQKSHVIEINIKSSITSTIVYYHKNKLHLLSGQHQNCEVLSSDNEFRDFTRRALPYEQYNDPTVSIIDAENVIIDTGVNLYLNYKKYTKAQRGFFASDGNNVWIGVNYVTMFRSTDKGDTWNNVRAGKYRAIKYSNGVWMVTEDTDDMHDKEKLLVSHDGVTWSEVSYTSPEAVRYHIKEFECVGNRWYLLFYETKEISGNLETTAHFVVSSDNGVTWEEISLPSDMATDYSSLAVRPNRVILVGMSAFGKTISALFLNKEWKWEDTKLNNHKLGVPLKCAISDKCYVIGGYGGSTVYAIYFDIKDYLS